MERPRDARGRFCRAEDQAEEQAEEQGRQDGYRYFSAQDVELISRFAREHLLSDRQGVNVTVQELNIYIGK